MVDRQQFEDLGVQILGIGTDTPFSQKTFADSLGLPDPLLSDFDGKVTQLHAADKLLEAGTDLTPVMAPGTRAKSVCTSAGFEDAARFDGAGPLAHLHVSSIAAGAGRARLLRVPIPWNDFLWLLIAANTSEMFPLQLTLALSRSVYTSESSGPILAAPCHREDDIVH